MDQDGTWHGGIGLSPGDFLLEGGAPPPRNGAEPAPLQFSAHFYCGQTAAWIKMPLDTEVGFGSDDIVLDGDAAPHPQEGDRAPFPIFGPCLLWPNSWMDQYGTWQHEGGPWSRPHCARWGPSCPPPKEG